MLKVRIGKGETSGQSLYLHVIDKTKLSDRKTKTRVTNNLKIQRG